MLTLEDAPALRLSPLNALTAVAAALAILVALVQLHGEYSGVEIAQIAAPFRKLGRSN